MRGAALGASLALAISGAAVAQTPAQERASAEAWVRGVYGEYTDGPDANGPGLYERVFSARLNRLIRLYGPNGEPGERGIDADPICACQDWERLRLQAVTTVRRAPGRVDATVRFTNAGETTRQTLRLDRERTGWRVDDVLTDGTSFAAEFRPDAEWLR